MFRIAALAAVLAVLMTPLFLFPRNAEAHAVLIRSNPENGAEVERAPLRVSLYFSEPLERKLTKVEVFDVERNRVDDGDLEFDSSDPTFASIGLQRDLPPGLYMVEFDNVSTVDGHPWSGLVQFIVLDEDGNIPAGVEFDPTASAGGGIGLLPPVSDVVLKWLSLVSLVLAAGAAFWLFAMARPAAAFLDDEPADIVRDRATHLTSLLAYAVLLLGLVSMALLIAVTVRRFGTDTSLWSYLTSIQTGRYRLAFVALTAVALLGAMTMSVGRPSWLRNLGLWSFLAASAGALLTFSVTSHGAVGAGSFWSITSDFVHLAASAVWAGALVMLVPFLLWVRRPLPDMERLLYTANVFDRFAIVAGLSVIAVLVTGLFNGLAQIPSWDALFDTAYGRVLVVKLALVVPLIAIAGANAFFLKPRLVAAIDARYDSASNAAARQESERALIRLQRMLPRTIAVEVALVVAVFASVAVLTQTSTAEGEIAQQRASERAAAGFRDNGGASGLTLDLEIKPNTVGLNQYTLAVRDEARQPVEGLLQVRLRFRYTDPTQPDVQAGQTELILLERQPGEYTANGANFSQPGSWAVEAGIRAEGADDAVYSFIVPVAAPETASEAGGRFALPFTSLNWAQVLGGVIVVLGGVVVVYARPLAPVVARSQSAVAAIGAAAVIAGGIVAFAVNPGSDTASANPIKPTTESIERGRVLFAQNCAVCHGDTGRGDGPGAVGLNPPPSDFRLHMPLHDDKQFYLFISEGRPGTAMVAWKDQLSDEDIWNLVNFLRAEFSSTPESRAAP